MRPTRSAAPGLLLLSVLLSLTSCAATKPRTPDPVVTAVEHTDVRHLQFTPMPDDATAKVASPRLPPGDLVNETLRAYIAAWRAALRTANAQLAAIRCLDAAEPDSAQARECLDALAATRGASP